MIGMVTGTTPMVDAGVAGAGIAGALFRVPPNA
jgi:predicted amidohydrolase